MTTAEAFVVVAWMACAGLPQPRSSRAEAAATRAAGAAFGCRAMSTSVVMASSVCSRASAMTSDSPFGRPPGFPDVPGWNDVQVR